MNLNINIPLPRLGSRINRLPRDTRDTLFMLAVIAWTVAPHLLRLSIGIDILCVLVLAWRAWLAVHEAPLPGRWTLLGVVFVAAGLTWINEHTLIGKDAGVTLLVVLMALKTLELRARRDALVVFFLGFFLVLTQFLYSQSLLTSLAMGAAVWGWLSALTLAHMPTGRPPLREAGLLALRAAAFGTPVMIALFLVFPRLPPLWAMPGRGTHTGLSDQLKLGDVAELAQDNSIAMRVRFTGAKPPPQAMYFRGPVLSDYDGQTWRAEPPLREFGGRPAEAKAAPKGKGFVDYELTIEPLRLMWLPLLDYTEAAPRTTPPMDGLLPPAGDSLQWRLRAPLGERLLLQARATLQLERSPVLSVYQQRDLTALPAGRHPRTIAWAQALRAQPELQDADATALATAVLRHIRTGLYTYTLEPGTYDKDPVDEFWLDRKLGFCEHYASAFTVIMRAMGVPTRIVTGYQGTDETEADGYWIVRQSHAHAWAEYWQQGRGWLRADPTSAVAPDRIQRSRALEAPQGLVAGTLEAVSPDLRLQLRQFFEAMDNRWNQWVLGYGKQQQFQLMDKLGLDARDTGQLIRLLVLGLAGLGLAGAAWAWWDGRRRTPWQKLQARVAKALARLGVPAPAHASPGALAQALLARHGEPARSLAASLSALQAMRYAPAASQTPPTFAAWWREFRRTLAVSPLNARNAARSP
ncbi:MAG TPA: DUF3488 and transglutaminase-like domain-containing protein [Ideonella sp.]|uniref:transglutaminase family protein n=1 Tax=Ideonella sp. TaxID=1929293 RepID=UPI002CC12BCB|nr:DUF3488 and transglutaminase-like domain-containing protein [Ideonella sp.]HSI47418.1 DUF3488 and transglutaminase-like domain-containing protein [Ideonella sp.]